jgi:hypothetical protein
MSERQEWQMWTTAVSKLYLNSFGSLTAPFYTVPLEAAIAWLYLYTPRQQAGDLAAIWQILQLPAAGVFLLIIGAFLKNLIYTRSSVDEWKTAFEKERQREREASEKAWEREREQFQIRLKELFTEKEYWREAWAKTQSLAVLEKQQGIALQHLAPQKE